MNLTPLDLIILSLATWRAAYFVTHEDGPWGFMARIRARWTLGGLLNCVYCASVWAAAAMLLLWLMPAQPVVVVAAISGGALMAASYSGANHA